MNSSSSSHAAAERTSQRVISIVLSPHFWSKPSGSDSNASTAPRQSSTLPSTVLVPPQDQRYKYKRDY